MSTAELNGNKELSADLKCLHELQYEVMQTFFCAMQSLLGWLQRTVQGGKTKFTPRTPHNLLKAVLFPGDHYLTQRKNCPKERVSNQTVWTDTGQNFSQCLVAFGAM